MQAEHWQCELDEKPPRPIPVPGIHRNVSFDEYKSWDAVSASSLKKAKTWQHYQEALTETFEPTADMKLGTLIHALFFEPDKLLRTYAVMPDFEKEIEDEFPGKWQSIRNTNEYQNRVKAWKAENEGKEIVEADWLAKVEAMHRSLCEHERAKQYLSMPAEREICLVWHDPETGILCKSRLDHVTPHEQAFTDLKSIADASRAEWQIKNLFYDMQMAWYQEGIMHCMGGEVYEPRIVFVENNGLHLVRAAPVSESAIEQGRRKYRTLLRQLARCRETNSWPGYEDPDYWFLPGDNTSVSLTVQGERITL